MVAVIVDGVWLPKAIPHFLCAPCGSEAYYNVLFKAYLYINVRELFQGAPKPSKVSLRTRNYGQSKNFRHLVTVQLTHCF